MSMAMDSMAILRHPRPNTIKRLDTSANSRLDTALELAHETRHSGWRFFVQGVRANLQRISASALVMRHVLRLTRHEIARSNFTDRNRRD